MKKQSLSFFSVLIALLLISCGANNAYLKFPRYDQVVKAFYKNYAYDAKGSGAISFEKRKDGWYAVYNDYSSGEPVPATNWKIWSAGSGNFEQLNFTGTADRERNKAEEERALYQLNSAYYFNICPYYGYVGWDQDVMNDFDGKSGLPDSTLFAVAHAYSTCAMNLLGNNYGTADKSKQFKLEEKANCMSAAQLEEYRKYQHRSIELMEEVEKMNPNYQTFVGDIHNKLSNEYMNAFLTLLYFQNEQEAMKEISKDLYNPFFISTAKNFLNSCQKNAVLFTYGDNDTYPLLYVQAKLGFRKDVQVINLSLFNLSRYISFMRRKVLDAPGIKLSLPEKDYADKAFEVVYISQNGSENSNCTLPAEEIIPTIKNRNSWVSMGREKLPVLYCKQIALNTPQGKLVWNIQRNYLLKSELALLDLLATEKLERPVYFANTVSGESSLGLKDYLTQEGFANRVSARAEAKFAGLVNTEVMYNNVMNVFSFEGCEALKGETEKRFASNYLISASALTDELIRSCKKDSALKVTEKLLKAFPNTAMPFEFEACRFAAVYFENGETEKAMNLINTILSNINKNYAAANAYEESRKQALYAYFKDMAEKYNQPQLKATCETALQKAYAGGSNKP